MRRLGTSAVLLAVLVASATGVDAIRESRAASSAAGATAQTGDPTPEALSRAFRRAAERALPGVVYVQVEGVRSARVEVPDPFRGTPWEDLFQFGRPEPAPRQGSGSGFIFREDGYILTNNHVVANAERVSVVLQDRREFVAEIVGRDPNTDVAVLKIDAKGLPVVPLGRSDHVAVGDWVVALGYPLRLGATATAGIVSATGRQIGIIDRSDGASAPLEHFIQTDAAINPGNSGGPLVDLEGRAIGMNTAIASPTGYYSGYGFAVPIDLVRRVADDLIEHGAVRRPKLGVGIATVDPADAEVYGLDRPVGAEVVRVEKGSAAEKAGVRLGDVIIGVDGRGVESPGDLMEHLARLEPGQEVTLEIIRYGERVRARVKLGEFESGVKASSSSSSGREDGVGRLGFSASEITPRLARQLRIDEGEGVVVTRVEAGSPAARAGIAPGMVIERFNGKAIKSIRDLERAARDVEPGRAVSLVVRLQDGSNTIINYRTRS